MKHFNEWLNENNFTSIYKQALTDKSNDPIELPSGPGSHLFDLLAQAIALADSTNKTITFRNGQGKVTINKEAAGRIYAKIMDVLEPYTIQNAF